MKLADLQRIENTRQPAAGMGLALDVNGFLSPAVIAFRAASARCTSTTTITATSSPGTDITGASFTLAEVGTYLIFGFFYMHWSASPGSAVSAIGELNVDGSVQLGAAILETTAAAEAGRGGTPGQAWLITTTSPNSVVKAAGWKNVAAGTLVIAQDNTVITALRVG